MHCHSYRVGHSRFNLKVWKYLIQHTKAGNKEAAAKARATAKRLAPEFGPAVINLFNKAEISDVKSAQAFFENSEDAFKIMGAGTARSQALEEEKES